MCTGSEFCLTDYSSKGHRRKEKVADLIGKLAVGGTRSGTANPPEVTKAEGWTEPGELFASCRAWRKEGGKEEKGRRGRKQVIHPTNNWALSMFRTSCVHTESRLTPGNELLVQD